MTTLTAVEGRTDVAADLERQLAHWLGAASTFTDAEEFASLEAWRAVEKEVGLPLRRELATTVERLLSMGQATAVLVRSARSDPGQIPAAANAVQAFRRRYAAVEQTLEFLGEAVNTRTSPALRAVLRNIDELAMLSMQPVLVPLRLPRVPVLSYVDKGMGASILRAGVRLWAPGTVNPVAALRVVRHNLYRFTSAFHEVGHQIAFMTGWATDVGRALGDVLADDPPLRTMWSPWVSEIVADVFAFVHTGYAAVAALYDVVGDRATVLRWPIGDPHPVGWIRTLLGCQMCRSTYGAGPWDSLERAVLAAHPLRSATPDLAALMERSRARLDRITQVCLATPVRGFQGRTITDLVDPRRVSPRALADLEREAGPTMWTSPELRRREGIRIVALTGLREAEDPDRAGEWIQRSRSWLTAGAPSA
jgi:hypothetical protein